MLLSVAASRKMQVKPLDVKTAFLHGEIAEELYMEQPLSFINQEHPDSVCKFQKGLYGQKEAAWVWNQELKKMLLQQNFKQGDADQYLFTRCINGHFTCILM